VLQCHGYRIRLPVLRRRFNCRLSTARGERKEPYKAVDTDTATGAETGKPAAMWSSASARPSSAHCNPRGRLVS
jgi:hypothetical protein